MKPLSEKPNVEIIRPVARQRAILRIAPYCRVSSDSDDQLHSYAAQIDYYTKLVGANPDWELVDIYADEASCTAMDKRDDLNRMLTDCRKGKIDKVLIKAIHRLARNTADCLTIIRDQADGRQCEKRAGAGYRKHGQRNVGHAMGEHGAGKSTSISQNMRWSYIKRMRAGEFITCKAPFGYDLIDGKTLELNVDQAKIVRWVFGSYLSGISPEEIADRLGAMGVATPESSPAWRPASVRYILTNEKYIGDTLAQKKMSTDNFPFIKKPQGEKINTTPSRDHLADAEKRERTQPRPGLDAEGIPASGKIVCGNAALPLNRQAAMSPGYAKHDRAVPIREPR